MLGVHKITTIILRGVLNLEIGKTSRVIIVVVQTTMKEIVGRKRGTRKSGTTNNKKNDSTTAACDGDIILACDYACVSLASQETDWIIDSGASYHITPYREMFIHHMLKNGWGVSKTKRHYLVFEMPIPCSECSFPFIPRLDAY